MRWSGVICCGLLAAGAMGARGQEHYVSHWGSNVPPYTSWETAATHLMDAVDVASNGATIWVSNGVYRTGSRTGGGLDARVMLTRPVVLRSVNGASNTFIEGAAHSLDEPLGPGAVRGVYMTDGVLDGFTIRHGHTDSGGEESAHAGAGVYAEGGELLNIRVIGNHGQTAGGGWLEGCRISNGVFRLNESETGPRVRIHRHVELEDCRIQNGIPPTADLKILGTNEAVIVNGDPDMDAGNGAWYGPHHVATGMVSHTFVLTNRGVRTLVIEGVEAQGGHTGDFAVVTAPPSVLQPGESAPLTIRFDPTAKGYRRALFYVKSSDADDDPYALWLGGEGLQYELLVLGPYGDWIENGSLEPTTADGTDFGSYVSAPIRHRFVVTNAGTALLTLTGTPRVAIGGEHPADFTVVQQPVASIVPGETTEFEIEFFPMVATTRTAEVSILGDDLFHTNGTYRFRIRGSCPPTNTFINALADIRAAAGSSMAWGDLDGDGLLDLGVLGYDGTNRFTEIYLNLGGGDFQNLEAGIVALESGRLAWGDYNNDGWLDLAVSGMSDSGVVTAIYRNEGDLTFTDIEAGLPGTMGGGLAWGDYDNDGDLDLAISGYTLSTSISRLFRNDGDETFTFVDFGLVPLQNGRAIWLDTAKTGWLDLMMSGDSSTGKTFRMYRNVDGVLSAYALPAVQGSAYGGLCAGDYNNDGRPDLVQTGYGTNGMLSEVYRFSGGSGLFSLATNPLSPLWLGTGEWGDLDNDGWQDLVISGEDAASRRAVHVYQNRNGALSALPTQIPGVRVSSVALGDSDRDGDLDLAISGLSTNGYESAVFRNLGSLSNAAPSAPTGLSATLTNGNEIVFRWSAALDDNTPSVSLTYNLVVGTESHPLAIMSPHADLDTGRRSVVGMGNVQYRREWHLRQLPSGERLVWGVQAIDGSYEGGAFAWGDPVDTDLLPDLVISSIEVMTAPFLATVTVSNRGAVASTGPVMLSAWVNRSAPATCEETPDWADAVDVLGAGEAVDVIMTGLPAMTNPGTGTFRAFINSECESPVREERTDNNQSICSYTNELYPAFWINAVPLNNSVFLRWSNPTAIGMQSSQVLLRWSDSAYPATTNDGTMIYNGTGQTFHHLGLSPMAPNYYSIWVTHDGTAWYEPD